MSKFLRGVLVSVVALFVLVSIVEAADSNFWVRIVDRSGNEITSGLRAYITDPTDLDAATVYSDANRTALTNATMATTLGPNDSADGGFDPGSDAVVKWWGPNSTYGLYVTDGYYWDLFESIDVNTHKVTFIGKNVRPNDGSFADSEPGRLVIIGTTGTDVFICTGTTSWVDISN